METSPTGSKEWLSSMTASGQVTIPSEVRRLLGISPHDTVAFVVQDGNVRIARSGSVVARTAGALRTGQKAETAEELRTAAEGAIAADAVARSEG